MATAMEQPLLNIPGNYSAGLIAAVAAMRLPAAGENPVLADAIAWRMALIELGLNWPGCSSCQWSDPAHFSGLRNVGLLLTLRKEICFYVLLQRLRIDKFCRF